MKLIILAWMVLTAALMVGLVHMGCPEMIAFWVFFSVMGGVMLVIFNDPAKIQ